MFVPARTSFTLAVFVALTAAAPARADLPPPDGTRYTGYGFRVDNVDAFADYVVLAYPVSESNGAPMTGYAEVTAGGVVQVGRRGGKPDLYAMRRADYAAWKPGYTDKHTYEDPQLTALFTGDKVRKCDASIQPRHTAPAGSPGEILDVFKAEAIDAKRCHIVAVTADAGTPSAPEPPVVTTPPPPPTPTTPPPPASAPAPTPAASGCRATGEPPPATLALLLLVGLVGRRRRPRSSPVPTSRRTS